MAAHLYVKENGVSKRYNPLKKDGTPYQRISKKMIEEDGAMIGITSQLKNHLDTGFLFNWAGKLGIQAGIDAMYDYVTGVLGFSCNMSDEAKEMNAKLATERFKEASTKAADRGTEFHDAIDSYIQGGELSADPIIANGQKNARQWLKEHGVTLGVKTEHCVTFQGGISIPADSGTSIRTILEIKNGATADGITQRLLFDWKTVEKSGGRYYTGKPEHCGQLAFCRHAAFHEGLCDHDAECWDVYIDRASGEVVKAIQWNEEQLWASLEFIGWCYETDRAFSKLEDAIKKGANV